MAFETKIEVTAQASHALDWNSLLSALLGGLFALAGVLLSQQWTDRGQREARLAELVEAVRASAMELTRYARGGIGERTEAAAVRLSRALVSLQAHGKRWEKRHNRAHRGFAATIRSLSREIATRIPAAEDGNSTKYLEALDALVVACVRWEEEPVAFRQGDRAADILEGRLRAPTL
jgi:uncharacterized protein (DUF4415 family)